MGTADDPLWRAGEVHELEIDRLNTHLCVRIRLQDVEHARALAERIEELPPVVVHRDSSTVIDGIHRLLAARLLQRTTVRAVYFEGSSDEAYVEAVRANVRHGKPLTLVERQSGATQILSRFPHWSDRRIASICGLSATTIGRIRARMGSASPPVDRREGRDGRVRRVTSPAERSAPTSALRELRGRPSVGAASRAGAWNAELRTLLGARLVDDVTLASLVDEIPVGYAYEVATRARECAAAWRRFADALDDKVRTRY